MTSLENFLNKGKGKTKDSLPMEPASGSFQCQESDCEEIVFEGYIDRPHGRIHWTCSQGHESSVVV
jgi:hypothetical protein